jgi:hypothetical protein
MVSVHEPYPLVLLDLITSKEEMVVAQPSATKLELTLCKNIVLLWLDSC